MPLGGEHVKDRLDAGQKGSIQPVPLGGTHSKGHEKDVRALPPDEQGVKDTGGDEALKGYQMFKKAAADLNHELRKIGDDVQTVKRETEAMDRDREELTQKAMKSL